jgi:hypothetical protein
VDTVTVDGDHAPPNSTRMARPVSGSWRRWVSWACTADELDELALERGDQLADQHHGHDHDDHRPRRVRAPPPPARRRPAVSVTSERRQEVGDLGAVARPADGAPWRSSGPVRAASDQQRPGDEPLVAGGISSPPLLM